MGLLYDHLRNQLIAKGKDEEFLLTLKNTPIYELSNVTGLFKDWHEERTRPIPKRPPHEILWAEWSYLGDRPLFPVPEMCRWTVGCFIITLTADAKSVFDCNDSLTNLPWIDAKNQHHDDFIGSHDEVCICHPFIRLNGAAEGTLSIGGKEHKGVIYTSNGFMLFGLTQDACLVDAVACSMRHPRFEGLPYLDVTKHSDYDLLTPTWPAFMAFSLLHCKNVSTETVQPTDPHRERNERRGIPPKREYKVLRLHLPGELRPSHVNDSPDDERKMRFHLCRGHFKNLKHERFKVKGWHWWPAHWRGSKDIGIVEKRYELHTAAPRL